MEQTQLAEKLKIETEILTLKRELKNVMQQTTSLKTEYAAIVALKENTETQLSEQKEYLITVQNDIASAKLSWANERSEEMDKLTQKMAEAENVIKRKAELNAQEETIRQIEAKNIDTLNESRRLELKLGNDKLELDTQSREIEKGKKDLEIKRENNLKEIADFKVSVLKVLKSAEKL